MDEQAHILVVEDESGILTSLQLLFELEGYRVSTASNGRQALQCLQERVPDLVLTDYVMPYMDGGQLISAMQAHPQWKSLPIILMSAMLPAGARPEEADAFLSKPFQIDALLELVERLLH